MIPVVTECKGFSNSRMTSENDNMNKHWTEHELVIFFQAYKRLASNPLKPINYSYIARLLHKTEADVQDLIIEHRSLLSADSPLAAVLTPLQVMDVPLGRESNYSSDDLGNSKSNISQETLPMPLSPMVVTLNADSDSESGLTTPSHSIIYSGPASSCSSPNPFTSSPQQDSFDSKEHNVRYPNHQYYMNSIRTMDEDEKMAVMALNDLRHWLPNGQFADWLQHESYHDHHQPYQFQSHPLQNHLYPGMFNPYCVLHHFMLEMRDKGMHDQQISAEYATFPDDHSFNNVVLPSPNSTNFPSQKSRDDVSSSGFGDGDYHLSSTHLPLTMIEMQPLNYDLPNIRHSIFSQSSPPSLLKSLYESLFLPINSKKRGQDEVSKLGQDNTGDLGLDGNDHLGKIYHSSGFPGPSYPFSPGLKRWFVYEFFYPTVDSSWYNQNEFIGCLRALKMGHVKTATRKEWRCIRLKIGKVRRFSPQFLREEMVKLEAYRNLQCACYIQQMRHAATSLKNNGFHHTIHFSPENHSLSSHESHANPLPSTHSIHGSILALSSLDKNPSEMVPKTTSSTYFDLTEDDAENLVEHSNHYDLQSDINTPQTGHIHCLVLRFKIKKKMYSSENDHDNNGNNSSNVHLVLVPGLVYQYHWEDYTYTVRLKNRFVRVKDTQVMLFQGSLAPHSLCSHGTDESYTSDTDLPASKRRLEPYPDNSDLLLIHHDHSSNGSSTEQAMLSLPLPSLFFNSVSSLHSNSDSFVDANGVDKSERSPPKSYNLELIACIISLLDLKEVILNKLTTFNNTNQLMFQARTQSINTPGDVHTSLYSDSQRRAYAHCIIRLEEVSSKLSVEMLKL